jgi:hypothetical protein
MEIKADAVNAYQQEFDLEIVVEKEVDGVGMGVLNDGTPFLNMRGLARMCGVDPAVIVRITNSWDDGVAKPREKPTDVCARLLAWERVLWMQRAARARKAHRCSAGCLIEVKRLTHEILKQKEIQ